MQGVIPVYPHKKKASERRKPFIGLIGFEPTTS